MSSDPEYNRDVTSLFVEAAAAMGPDSLLFADGYTLHDAMSVFEIGEPRLDTGMMVDREQEKRSPFNPQALLLPEELCWMLDRSLAYEMQWHIGNHLQHTVHTFLYVHFLEDMDHDLFPPLFDPQRPVELVSVVLRAAVAGSLKCCDWTWRELSVGVLQDLEDWQSEKCDVSLLEGVQPNMVLDKLDRALHWLLNTQRIPDHWRNALIARLLLRQTLLQLFSTSLRSQSIPILLSNTRRHLSSVVSYPSPTPSPTSPALKAFDPYIARKLHTFSPINVIKLPEETWRDDTWTQISRLVDGWEQVARLRESEELRTWEIVGNLQTYLPSPPLPAPFIRSLAASTFSDGIQILGTYPPNWLTERFFFEHCSIGFGEIAEMILERSPGVRDGLRQLEGRLHRVITKHIQSLWYNPPRRRRHFMKEVVEWQDMSEYLRRVILAYIPRDILTNPTSILSHLQTLILLPQLALIREIILSGFQLQLYSPTERGFAYWYLVQMVEKELIGIDGLLGIVRQGSRAQEEMEWDRLWLGALQCMAIGMVLLINPRTPYNWHQTRENFFRRYKWAFKQDVQGEGRPELQNYLSLNMGLRDDSRASPSEHFTLAYDMLDNLRTGQTRGGWAWEWEAERMRFINQLSTTCSNLRNLPETLEGVRVFDMSRLVWDVETDPWFPVLQG